MAVELILTRGLPGSGKTTWAKQWVAYDTTRRARVNRDDLRFAMFDAYVLTSSQENAVSVAQEAQVAALLSRGISVIVDDTNLRASTVKKWYDIASINGAVVDFADFEVSVETAIARDKARAEAGGRGVGQDVIRNFAARYLHKGRLPKVPEPRSKTPALVPYDNDDTTLPTAILCDLDGTMAKNVSGRGFYDWKRVGEDDLVQTVHDTVVALHTLVIADEIIFMSGRDAVCRPETTEWLKRHNLPVDHLYMRPEGSMEEDSKVKLDLFNEHIRDKYRVVAVFDDRISVARLWHALGLPLFRVGDPDAVF
jgi:predicted kinase